MTFGFDKIYVLSLITNKDRQEFIKKQFKELDIDFEFVFGIDFRNIKSTINKEEIIYPEVWNKNLNERDTTGGDIGCVLAHYQAVLQAYEFGYNNVLIFEDDVCFIKDKNLIYECLNNIPFDRDFITWDPRFIWKSDIDNLVKDMVTSDSLYINLSNKYKSLIGGMMYSIMNRKMMKVYLDVQRNRLSMSDHVLGFFRNPIVKRSVCTKCICLEQHVLLTNFIDIMYGHIPIYTYMQNFNIKQFYYPDKYLEFTREERDENRQLLNSKKRGK